MCLYMGHSILQSKLRALLSSPGLDPAGKSNHSLRATGTSRMYNSGVPEKLIMERSGQQQRSSSIRENDHKAAAGCLWCSGSERATYGGDLAATETKREPWTCGSATK